MSILVTTPQKEISGHGIVIQQDKNTFPYFCSHMLSHFPGLLLKWLFLRPDSQLNLVSILDNRQCPEKGKSDHGCTPQCLLTVGEAKFLIVLLLDQGQGKARPPEQPCQESADEEATKSRSKHWGSSNPGTLPALQLHPERFPELLLFFFFCGEAAEFVLALP